MNVFWEDEEVKTLFKFVEIKKSEGMPLLKIFYEYAKCTKRHQNSVRNYYYTETKRLAKDNERRKRLNINVDEHTAKQPQPFSNAETQDVINSINKMVEEGMSVRRACLHLAGGDATKMVRLQNKYRSEQKLKTDKNMNNVIKMPIKKDYMTDEDINALFIGLIRLIKRQETSKAKDLVQEELSLANQKLRKAMAEIVAGQERIAKLQAEITFLKEKVSNAEEKEIETKIKNLNINLKSAKSLLKEFVNKKSDTQKTSNAQTQ